MISFGSKKDGKTKGKHLEFVERMHQHGYTERQVRRLVEWYMRRSEEHTSELQSRSDLVCRLLLEKKKKHTHVTVYPKALTTTTTKRDALDKQNPTETSCLSNAAA